MKETPKHSVMFAVPCYEQKVCVPTMVMLLGATVRCSQRGWGVGIETFGGNAGIHLIRNWFCKTFLDSPCTDLFFVDSDVSCSPDDVVRMIEHPVDVVLGLYRARREPEIYTFLGEDDPYIDPNTGLLLIRAGPAGFMRVRRHVIQRMADSLRPDQWCPMPTGGAGLIPTLFNFDQRNGHYVGEDAFFGLKWEEMGGKTWVDPNIHLTHTGVTSFSSTFADAIRETQRIDMERKRFEELTNVQ